MWHNGAMLKEQCYRDKSRGGAHSSDREEKALSHTAQILAVTNPYQLLGTWALCFLTLDSVHLMQGFLPVKLP